MTTANAQSRNTKPQKARTTAKPAVRAARGPAQADQTKARKSPVIPSDGPAAEPEFEGIIGSYNPLKSKFPLCSREEWEAVAPVVRAAVGRLDRLADRGMRPYLTAMTRLAVWAHREGLPLGVEVLLSHPMLKAHTATLDGSVGTFRSQLRRLAAANGVPVEATRRGFDRPEYSQPYTLDEVRALLRFATSLSNENRRQQLTGFCYSVQAAASPVEIFGAYAVTTSIGTMRFCMCQPRIDALRSSTSSSLTSRRTSVGAGMVRLSG